MIPDFILTRSLRKHTQLGKLLVFTHLIDRQTHTDYDLPFTCLKLLIQGLSTLLSPIYQSRLLISYKRSCVVMTT